MLTWVQYEEEVQYQRFIRFGLIRLSFQLSFATSFVILIAQGNPINDASLLTDNNFLSFVVTNILLNYSNLKMY